ncbi:MAG: glycoside hydrolase family 25 protein [Polyangia bacterium]
MIRAAFFATLSLAVAACQPLPPDVGVAEEGLSVCPGKTTLEGVDVSTYQGTIDWAKVKASGRAFAITRVGDGLGGDNTFNANWAGIKAAGMVRGAYQFFRASDDPIQQADILLAKIGTPQNGDLAPTLDLEVTDGQSASVIVTKVKQWLEHVKAKTGRTPMVYTSPGFWPSVGSPDLSAYVLWVAHWGTTCPTIPPGWKGFTFHQYSDSGSVSGISGAVDLDVFNGDKAALDKLASNNTAPPADGGTAHDLGGAASDGGTGGDDLAGGGGAGGGGGDGTGGNGDTGGKGDTTGTAMGHGCSVGGAGDGAAAPLVLVLALFLARYLRPNSRDQKRRRGVRGPA